MTKADRDGIGLGIAGIVVFILFVAFLYTNTPEPTHDGKYPILYINTYEKHKKQCDGNHEWSEASCRVVEVMCESVDLKHIQENCNE